MQRAEFEEQHNYQNSTQVMQQYLDVKFAHLDCLVLFRMGDFYELFYEDAITASRVLGVALTKRGKDARGQEIAMCGVPYHALENYLNKLLQEDFKVAICDQLETPEEAKKRGGYKAVVHRSVTRIITPGTIIEESLLSDISPNYLVSISYAKNNYAISYIDLSTSYLAILELPEKEIINELVKLNPKEILLAEKYRASELAINITEQFGHKISFQVDSFFSLNKCEKNICEFYNIQSTKAIGDLSDVQISSFGSILEYICLTQKKYVPKLSKPKILSFCKYMGIDASTRKNLELMRTNNGEYNGSLFWCLNKTVTKGGGRLLAQYLTNPLLDIEKINLRLDKVEFFYQYMDLTENIRKYLKQTGDLERCTTRLNMGRATPKDLLSIKYTIEVTNKIIAYFTHHIGIEFPHYIDHIIKPLFNLEEIYALIAESIKEEAGNDISCGDVIKQGYDNKVDELNEILSGSQAYLIKLQNTYRQKTGIESLKINNNNILGLFIEVTSKNAQKINNEHFIHRQTTINAVRYTTVELQAIEAKIVNAKALVAKLEQEIYNDICAQLVNNQLALMRMAKSISLLDLFMSFAVLAYNNDYTRPVLNDGTDFHIIGGRHPIIEQKLKRNNHTFVSNECNLQFEKRLWLITGPNMAGKSTFLRQNAIIAIMAQLGSFVPAEKAEIGIIDRIFSRIGAGDDLGKGQSTFMLEMLETSNILAQATNKSLVILDEVGRGTSTYDGVAIAWSVLEYIHDKIRTRCLFATHYHELTNMSDIFPALVNYTVEVQELNDKILFLYKIKPGSADKSYGIHVAEIAGLPNSVINKAKQILVKLEKDTNSKKKDILKSESNNLSMFDLASKNNSNEDELRALFLKIEAINPDLISPKEALSLIYELKAISNSKKV